MNDKRITHIEYTNGDKFKFENGRVVVAALQDDNYIIKFTVLSDDLTPRAIHNVRKGKVVETIIKLSKEAAIALVIGLDRQLEKNDQ